MSGFFDNPINYGCSMSESEWHDWLPPPCADPSIPQRLKYPPPAYLGEFSARHNELGSWCVKFTFWTFLMFCMWMSCHFLKLLFLKIIRRLQIACFDSFRHMAGLTNSTCQQNYWFVWISFELKQQTCANDPASGISHFYVTWTWNRLTTSTANGTSTELHIYVHFICIFITLSRISHYVPAKTFTKLYY